MMVVLGHALNSIVSRSGAAVKIIANQQIDRKADWHSIGWPKALTQGCALGRAMLIQKILTPQVFWSHTFNA
jgi:hypothetical protein